MNALDLIAQGSMKEETPKFQIGDTVKVAVKIREGSRERIQMFEGTVIAKAAKVKENLQRDNAAKAADAE